MSDVAKADLVAARAAENWVQEVHAAFRLAIDSRLEYRVHDLGRLLSEPPSAQGLSYGAVRFSQMAGNLLCFGFLSDEAKYLALEAFSMEFKCATRS